MIDCWIAIVGGLDRSRTSLGLRHLPRATVAASLIGRALAEKGCGIVVYSGDPVFAEPHVVSGYASSDQAAPDSIHVIYPRRGEPPTFAEHEAKPGCFKFRVSTHKSWEVSFYRSLHHVDGVVVIGGGESTFIAGILGTTRQMPLVALESYGGAAAKVWELIEPSECLITKEEKELMAEGAPSDKWARDVVTCLLAQRQRLRDMAQRRVETAQKHRQKLAGEAAAGLTLLGAALAMVVATWDAKTARALLLTALVVAPAIAGASASLIRGLWEQVAPAMAGRLRERTRPVWVMSALGGAAGAIAGLLYVVAQLSAAESSSDGTLPPIAARLVPFALLTGFLTGFATDTFFRRMAEREIDPIKVPAVTVPPATST